MTESSKQSPWAMGDQMEGNAEALAEAKAKVEELAAALGPEGIEKDIALAFTALALKRGVVGAELSSFFKFFTLAMGLAHRNAEVRLLRTLIDGFKDSLAQVKSEGMTGEQAIAAVVNDLEVLLYQSSLVFGLRRAKFMEIVEREAREGEK